MALVAARKATGNAWLPYEWHAVLCRAKREDDLAGQADERGTVVGVAPLTLHRTEAENYLFNLSGAEAPSIYSIMNKPADEGGYPELVALTCDPYEAQSFALANDRVVDALPMSPEIEAWVRGFVAAHYKEEPFVKRQRTPHGAKPKKRDDHGA